jgi:uncharacterized cysteine cluster protein YcgN (CxxCxxCC family)
MNYIIKSKPDLCQRCGECCRLKAWDPSQSKFIRTEKTCPHLRFCSDGKFMCEVYQNRPKMVDMDGVMTECTNAEKAAKNGLLPPYCPYAMQIPNYKTRVVNYVDYGRDLNKSRVKGFLRQRAGHMERVKDFNRDSTKSDKDKLKSLGCEFRHWYNISNRKEMHINIIISELEHIFEKSLRLQGVRPKVKVRTSFSVGDGFGGRTAENKITLSDIQDTYPLNNKTIKIGGFVLDASYSGTFRHEYGHIVWNSILTDKEIEKWYLLIKDKELSYLKSKISLYASTEGDCKSRGKKFKASIIESFTESFAAYFHPNYKKELPSEIHDFFETILGGKGK